MWSSLPVITFQKFDVITGSVEVGLGTVWFFTVKYRMHCFRWSKQTKGENVKFVFKTNKIQNYFY